MDQFIYYQNYQYANVSNNRVYINRNFNRIGPESVPVLPHSNFMYLNPNFTPTLCPQNNTVHKTDQGIRPKIHVNPNFIKSRTQRNEPIITDPQSAALLPAVQDTRFHAAYIEEKLKVKESTVHTQSATVTKSRYCLVRQNKNKPLKSPIVKTPNTLQTVTVNKYKLVSLNVMKKNLTFDKPATLKTNGTKSNSNFIKSKYKIRLKASPSNIQTTRFKFIKRNSIAATLNTSGTKQCKGKRVSLAFNKNILKTSLRQTKKISMKTMKKNNIPCPLFKKYGTCLRMARGKCDYLHDKKHVSICRKFLKGICHDQQCLLSHDLTDKKMPTCYFYLQGNCTKEKCPYLHVKLSENTKICPDFVKGYCERGDKCLHRHVYVSTGTSSSKVQANKQNSHKCMAEKNNCDKTKKYESAINLKSLKVIVPRVNKVSTGIEQRYFKDLTDDSASAEQCDLIKPIRCKLGTLPSFIQF